MIIIVYSEVSLIEVSRMLVQKEREVTISIDKKRE